MWCWAVTLWPVEFRTKRETRDLSWWIFWHSWDFSWIPRQISGFTPQISGIIWNDWNYSAKYDCQMNPNDDKTMMILRYFKWWAQSSAARTGEHFNVNLSAPVAHEKSLSPASWLTMTMMMMTMMMMKMKMKRRRRNHPAPNFPTPALPVEAQAVSIPEHQLLVIAARHQGWSTRMEGKALDLAPSPSAHHTWPAMPAMPAIRHFKSLQTSTNI